MFYFIYITFILFTILSFKIRVFGQSMPCCLHRGCIHNKFSSFNFHRLHFSVHFFLVLAFCHYGQFGVRRGLWSSVALSLSLFKDHGCVLFVCFVCFFSLPSRMIRSNQWS